MFLGLRSLSHPAHAHRALLIAGAFGLGIAAASFVGPSLPTLRHDAVAVPAASAARPDRISAPSAHYRAELLRVIDGDTVEARVHLWPGLDVTTRVRLRGIDAPEMHARCPQERRQAEAARDALAALLHDGNIGVSEVGLGKYAGRVLATVSTAETANVSETLLERGLVRRYAGGRRRSWCNNFG
jgi:endonuclease YncB( thermonuclease family)